MLKKSLQRLKSLTKHALTLSSDATAGDLQVISAGSPIIVSGKTVLLQTLGARRFKTARISILFGTFGRKNDCNVDVRLFSKNFELLHHETVSATQLDDNTYYSLKLPADFVYRDELCLAIASPDATETNCVAIWTKADITSCLREVPRQRKAITDITPSTPGGSEYPGIALVAESDDLKVAGLQAVSAGSPIVVSEKNVLLQSLDTRPFEIGRLSILFGTFGRQNDCHVDLRLFSKDFGLLHHETVSATVLGDNARYSLRLPTDFVYRGELYLAIASPDATETNFVAVWTRAESTSCLREVPRWGEAIADITPLTAGGSEHPGVALITELAHHGSGQSSRSYLREPIGPATGAQALPGMYAMVGFDDIQRQSLEALNRDDRLRLLPLDLARLEPFPSCQALLFPAELDAAEGKILGRFARQKKMPLIAVSTDEQPLQRKTLDALPGYADGLLCVKPQANTRLPQGILGGELYHPLGEVLNTYQRRQLPKVSIVTILSGKAEQLRWVIKSYFDQTYAGEIEIIYVNDCFGDAETVVAEEFARNEDQPHVPRLGYRTLRNDQNLGNCASRNRGVAAASGDIVVIIDSDCMLNKGFVAAHVDAHSYLDCEVVIGPHNIETNGVPPAIKLSELEQNPTQALSESDLQDRVFLDGFLNCITRNFSIKKTAIVEDLFDLDFSYSLSPKSGFGWEDVEMGYRLYKRALGIKFTDDAFSVHISHTSSVPESEKPKKSIRNFRKLFVKHPELRDLARRWATRTLDTLSEWSSKVDPAHAENQDLIELNSLFSDAPRPLNVAVSGRKLRILTYRWHVPHQYELYKSGHDFFLVRGAGTAMCDQWEYGHRPLPLNAQFIDHDAVQESEFDLALLHFDENVLAYENTNDKIGPEWGATFRWFVDNIKLPKVAICHGTPQFHGQYTPGYDKPDLMNVIEPARVALVEYVKDIEIVCNSYQAKREWGFHKSRVIWHGFDPVEFLPSTYGKGILSPLGPLVVSRPHYRGYYVYQQVFSDFPDEFRPETLMVADPDIDYVNNVFAVAKYKNYVNQIRQYSVYFNPTLRSPMPRARCEPMMCGVVTVNANNHDVDLFIKNGVNGFYSNEPAELREQLLYLMRNPEATRKIGAEARKTGMTVFNYDRYLADWAALLSSVS
ncbi:glycosyltransferase [Uliginosibacterium sp. H3]|uniref:Glycosyltransferase n=1 Tax=Uliginosibacterium silvisoli TaxID=3114758 RepID=A0ABU6K1E6_9RHOO|nr:glycosyltransferase [Uliginosibacterium sp. H3]